MIRQILTVLLPIVAPTIVYFLWMRFRRGTQENPPPPPWLWLAGTGAALAIVTLLVTGIHSGSSRDSQYQPWRFENGVLVPGRITTPADSPAPGG